MATITKCDKCKKEIKGEFRVLSVCKEAEDGCVSGCKDYDLCEQCWLKATAKFFEWLR